MESFHCHVLSIENNKTKNNIFTTVSHTSIGGDGCLGGDDETGFT